MYLFIIFFLIFACKITKKYAFREFFRQKICTIQIFAVPLHPLNKNSNALTSTNLLQ